MKTTKTDVLFLCQFLALALVLTGCRLAPAGAPEPTPQPTKLPAATVLPTATATAIPTRTPSATPTLSTWEALQITSLPARDPVALAERLKGLTGIPRIVHATPPAYHVGDQTVFWVSDQDIASHFPATATLRYLLPHTAMWVQEGYNVDDADLRRAAERFEYQTYPTTRAYFGSEWFPGVDSDPRISIFNGRVPGAAGYFYSPNQYSRQVNPFSNEREMFFVNLDIRRPGTLDYDATLAHEFQHMIHWYQDRNEDTWVTEGLSMLSEQVNGLPVAPHALSYSRRPDTQLTAWAIGQEDPSPYYGASYLFMAYFAERFGKEAVKALVAAEPNGPAGFNAVLASMGRAERFEDLFADWVIANYLNDLSIGDGRYGYQSVKVARPAEEQVHITFPITVEAQVRPYGVDYIRLNSASAQDVTIDFAGEPQTRLASMTPHSGRWAFWSNRGDEIDSTLTRTFDLTSVNRATLSVWLWYDIEPDWDYVFVEISTNGGATWQILEGPHATWTNPNGNSYGPAYTGVSGNGQEPVWIEEHFDLTPYTGRPVSIRFELVTDDAVNHVGLFLDDISIPEIGYAEDFERDAGGWQALGFVRADNILPQRYLVQLIELEKSGIVIRRMQLDERQRGRLEIHGLGREGKQAVLVVSAFAPATTEPAPYRYAVWPAKGVIGGGW